jgi:hypothetical protein
MALDYAVLLLAQEARLHGTALYGWVGCWRLGAMTVATVSHIYFSRYLTILANTKAFLNVLSYFELPHLTSRPCISYEPIVVVTT